MDSSDEDECMDDLMDMEDQMESCDILYGGALRISKPMRMEESKQNDDQ